MFRTRLLETGPRLTPGGASRHLDTITVDWYVPGGGHEQLSSILYIITCFAGEAELEGVKTLLKKFFFPALEMLTKFASGHAEVDKEARQRHLKFVRKIVVAVSELSGPETRGAGSSALSSVMGWMDKLHIRQTCRQYLTTF